MYIASITMIVTVLLFLATLALQVFLSRRESRWPGLILPILCGLYTLLCILSMVDTGSAWENIRAVLMILVMTSIPTAIYLGIYWSCRGRAKRRREQEKMQIRDL